MLNRRAFLFGSSLLALGACGGGVSSPALGPDGKPLPRVYRIAPGERTAVQFRMLDSINSLRAAVGAAPVSFNAALNAAAATHAKDMARQNRPWHFGSDASSPVDRVRRVGYPGLLVGETISETFETELETLAAWMEQQDTRRIILDRRATDVGFEWHQENNGKLWWVLEVGAANTAIDLATL